MTIALVVSTQRLPPENLYRITFEAAQEHRRRGPERLAQQVQRIEARRHGEGAQEQRRGTDEEQR